MEGAELVGGEVGDGAHEQAAGRGPFGRQALVGHPSRGVQPLRAGDEVGERVLLLQEFAVVVPGAAHLAAPADVGEGQDDAALEG